MINMCFKEDYFVSQRKATSKKDLIEEVKKGKRLRERFIWVENWLDEMYFYSFYLLASFRANLTYDFKGTLLKLKNIATNIKVELNKVSIWAIFIK